MTAHRVYIASESALALEKRIGADGRYQVLVRCPYPGDGWKEKLLAAGAERVMDYGDGALLSLPCWS